jgi:hypothetical protein
MELVPFCSGWAISRILGRYGLDMDHRKKIPVTKVRARAMAVICEEDGVKGTQIGEGVGWVGVGVRGGCNCWWAPDSDKWPRGVYFTPHQAPVSSLCLQLPNGLEHQSSDLPATTASNAKS